MMMKRIVKKIKLLSLLFYFLTPLTGFGLSPLPPETEEFINHMVQDYHFDKRELTQVFNQVEYQPSIIKSITTPYEKQPWYIYQRHFLTDSRIQKGVEYWDQHVDALNAAEKTYGVDPSIIVAIIGIETRYGEHIGDFRVIDALSTLAFYYPSRAAFFKHELEQFLLLTQEQHQSPFILKGSYAGAIGIPQFMPSSCRNYGVNYSHQGGLNLSTHHDDAIMSVANYFKAQHWTAGKPIAIPVTLKHSSSDVILSASAKPEFTLEELEKQGVKLKTPLKIQQKAAIIELKGEKEDEYWLVFPNFQAIMKYNPSIDYAMAIYQLSQGIRAKRHLQQTNYRVTF